MNTISEQADGLRRRRRQHSDEFKAEAVAACSHPGVSMAAVALERGINANLLRRWVNGPQARPSGVLPTTAPRIVSAKPTFIPLQMPQPDPVADIRVEIRKGSMSVALRWPTSAASDCAVWLRELLR